MLKGGIFFLCVCADGSTYGKGQKRQTFVPGRLFRQRENPRFLKAYLANAGLQKTWIFALTKNHVKSSKKKNPALSAVRIYSFSKNAEMRFFLM